jgi:hypothetical protein
VLATHNGTPYQDGFGNWVYGGYAFPVTGGQVYHCWTVVTLADGTTLKSDRWWANYYGCGKNGLDLGP